MKRREFVSAGLAIAGSLTATVGRGQMVTRAAVVIGVDRVSTFEPLRAAASGAKRVADWLTAEGFTTVLLTDAVKPVTASEIFNAIHAFAKRGTVEQLVVYFAGHGFINHMTEYWLLSHAPGNPNEAVNLTESRTLARRVGIPNVVFISDACRSPASGLGATGVRGSQIFPNQGGPGNVTCDVDHFLATRIGDPAWEVGQAPTDAYGIYTDCLLEAFKKPYPSMVRTVNGQAVLPNRQLRVYLAREVPKKAQAAPKPVVQIPDAEICSDEPTYIGRVLTPERLAEPAPLLRPASLADVASAAINIGVGGGTVTKPTDATVALARSSGFDDARNEVVRARGIERELPLTRGFAVSGARVKDVTVSHGGSARIVNSRESERPSAGVEIDLRGRDAATVALEFTDGTGTVLAGLSYFIGTITVDKGRVTNVSYSPSRRSPLWSEYQHEAERLDRLRADVAAAARLGVLRFEGPRAQRKSAANALADRIRMLKGIDPTLGLYAAYAYSDADASDQVRSVEHYVRENLNADLYDIAMLSGKLANPTGVRGPYPFCPMLAQGWSLLRAKGVKVNELVDAARDHMIPSLWTTFDRTGVDLVRKAALAQR
jgi:hypothetical protein